jgi:hypothetical protein
MTLALVRHRVNDFDTFHEVYDSFAPMQAGGGVTADAVRRMSGGPDDVLATHKFDSLEKAQGVFAKPDLRNAMVRGGGKGEPPIEFFD